MYPAHTLGILMLVFQAHGQKSTYPNAYKVVEDIILDEAYDLHIRPSMLIDDDTPTVVELAVYVDDVNSFSEVDMDYTVDISFLQRWMDTRLTTNIPHSITLDYKLLDELWVPDSYFVNEKEAELHEVTTPNVMVLVEPNGTVTYSQRLTLKLGCVFKLSRFPFDEQLCSIPMSSYGSRIGELQFVWFPTNHVAVNEEMQLPDMFLHEFHTSNCTRQHFLLGTFSCLSIDLTFHRRTGYYLINTYIPSVLIVILSWIAFWIDYHAVPARISIGLLTVLTLSTQNTGISATLPRVSYVKAIDVWMSTCLVFVFGALLEYCLVNVLTRKSQRVVDQADTPDELGKSSDQKNETTNTNRRAKEAWNKVRDSILSPEKYGTDNALMVDVVARVLFPTAFGIFNIVYWIIYLP